MPIEWITDGHKITVHIDHDYPKIAEVICPRDVRGRCRLLRPLNPEEAKEYKGILAAALEKDEVVEEVLLSGDREVVEGELIIPAPSEPRMPGDCWVTQELSEFHLECFDTSVPITITSSEMEIAWRFEGSDDLYVTFISDPKVAFKKGE